MVLVLNLHCPTNLLATLPRGRGVTFAYFGAGTGTSPLPIMVSYLQAGNPNPNLAASYGANFASQTFIPSLSPANPNVIGFASTLANNATTRANGAAAGRPANFFHNCPTTLGFCFQFDNSERSWLSGCYLGPPQNVCCLRFGELPIR